jgi:iron-sulfur cluster assembly protein
VLDLVEEEPTEADEELESHGVKLLVDMKSMLYLDGTVIDYHDEGVMRQGFTFKNPNETSKCGCGSSFTV